MNRLDPQKFQSIFEIRSYFNVRTFKIFKMFGTDEFINKIWLILIKVSIYVIYFTQTNL